MCKTFCLIHFSLMVAMCKIPDTTKQYQDKMVVFK